MTEQKFTSSLDVLAEAALFYSDNQENISRSMNCTIGPKKFIQYRYEAEQNSTATNSTNLEFNADRLHSSGYVSSSPNESNHSSSSSNGSNELRSYYESSPTYDEEATKSTSKKSKRVKKTVSNKRTKKNSTTSTTSTTSTKDGDLNLNKFVTSISIKSKDAKESNDDDVFDETGDLKILVKTPKLSYTLRGMRKRKPSTKTPDSLKDEDYYEKRRRNNLAAKKSRNNKNLAVEQSAIRLKQLETERFELDQELGKEIMIMKLIQEKMQEDEQLKQRVMDFVNEKNLTLFLNVLDLNLD